MPINPKSLLKMIVRDLRRMVLIAIHISSKNHYRKSHDFRSGKTQLTFPNEQLAHLKI